MGEEKGGYWDEHTFLQDSWDQFASSNRSATSQDKVPGWSGLEPVLAHPPMRRERLEVCNNAAGSSAAAQRCAGSRARMSDQKAASAGAQHVCRFATRLLLRVALLLAFSCTGSVVGVAPTRRSKLRPWYAWPEINPFQKDKPPAGFMITTHKVGDGAVQELMIPSTS